MKDMITCGEARRLLWPDAGPRLASDEVMRAQGHVAECDACRAFLDDMRTLADRVRATAPQLEAPLAVRDRLFKSIARERTAAPGPTRARRRLWSAAAGLAVAAVGLVAGARMLHRPADDGPMAIFAEDHLRAVGAEGITSSDSLTVARWLSARLPMAVEVPLFPSARLKGGRLSLIGDERGAVLEYDFDGRPLSYFIVPARMRAGARVGMPELRYAARAGYRVVAWQDAGLTHALVADLPEKRLLALARYCMKQMMALVRHPELAMPPL